MSGAESIAWTALEIGAPVLGADGEELGRVSSVVADEQKDIFSGVAFRARMVDTQRFVPADAIDEITTGGVRLKLRSADVDSLETYEA